MEMQRRDGDGDGHGHGHGHGDGDTNESLPDFEDRIDADAVHDILRFMDDPADIVRFAASCRYLYDIVVERRYLRDLCIKICPEVALFDSVFEEDKVNSCGETSSNKSMERNTLKTELRLYSKLAYELRKPPVDQNCISDAICASSTDNEPDENIIHTLDPRHRTIERPLYWSSKGESNINVPETLTYRLQRKMFVIHEVRIHPFKAYFQRGAPIYSSKAVRFRCGHQLSATQNERLVMDESESPNTNSSDEYHWTYVSPEYTMNQEDTLQFFRFPRPVLCIGDILQVELLGRVQAQEMDGLYYICMCHVYVVGRPISSLDFNVVGNPKKYILRASKHQENSGRTLEGEPVANSGEEETDIFSIELARFRARRILNMLGNIGVMNLVPDDDSDSDDDYAI